MTPQNVLDITRDGLLLVFWVSLPIVLVAAGSALVVALAQAVTQVQDQSIGQSVRLVSVMLTIVFLGSWMGRDVLLFAERSLQTLVQLK